MREERNTSVNLEQDSEPGAAQTLQTPGRSDGTRGRGISRSRKASRGRRTSEIRENAEKRDNSVSREGAKRRSGRRRISIPVILLALAVGFGAGFGTGWLKWAALYSRPESGGRACLGGAGFHPKKYFFQTGCKLEKGEQHCNSLCSQSWLNRPGQPGLF